MADNADTVHTARLLVAQLGLTPDDLVWTPPTAVPTLAEYLPKVIAAEGPGAQRTYSTYWQRILDAFGDRRLDQITATDIETLMRQVMATTIHRRNHQHGRYAGEHLIAAIRAIYTHAVADELIPPHRNPAAKVRKPRRPPCSRRALSAAETGNDAALDSLLLRLHTETACRRAAALELTEDDIDPDWCLLRLHEKNSIIRWQPASPTLITALLDHLDGRGIRHPTAALLRYADGSPLTTRRYDHLWKRIGKHLPWVAKQNISIHWLRHTTLTWVERHHGYAIAHEYAGHHDKPDTATPTYLHADIHDIATALATLTGEPHPLARTTNPPAIPCPPQPIDTPLQVADHPLTIRQCTRDGRPSRAHGSTKAHRHQRTPGGVMRHAAATGHVHAATGLGPPQSADARLGARPLPPAAVGPSR